MLVQPAAPRETKKYHRRCPEVQPGLLDGAVMSLRGCAGLIAGGRIAPVKLL